MQMLLNITTSDALLNITTSDATWFTMPKAFMNKCILYNYLCHIGAKV